MREFLVKKSARIVSSLIPVPFLALGLFALFSDESLLFKMFGAGFILFAGGFFIDIWRRKIVLGGDFIGERNLFGLKKVYFRDIDKIEVAGLFSVINGRGKKIHLSRLLLKDYDELLASISAITKTNKSILFRGDPILIHSYFDRISPTETVLIPQFDEGSAEIEILKTELVRKRWLVRVVDLKARKETFRITYFGRGEGYECIFFNERLVSKKDTHVWYAPRFEFDIAGTPASVNIRMYPWLTIRKFWIEIGGKIVYSEG